MSTATLIQADALAAPRVPALTLAHSPRHVATAVQSTSQRLDGPTRHQMERAFGHRFEHVQIHANSTAARSASTLDAHAYTLDNHIVFGRGRYQPDTSHGRALIAHELVHVMQQDRGRASSTVAVPEQQLERQAATLPAQALASRSTPGIRPDVHPAAPQVQRQPAHGGMAPILEFAILMSQASFSDADARHALDLFRLLSAAERETALKAYYPSGQISRMLAALRPQDSAGPYKDVIREILRWIEEFETRAASGLSDDKMAEKQAKFQQAEATKAAEAQIKSSTPKGVTPAKPTQAQVQSAIKKNVEKTSITPTTTTTWDKMPKATRDDWEKRGKAVIGKVVALANSKHPELKLTAAQFLADFAGVEKRGQGVLAYGQDDGHGGTLAVFGFSFVEAAEADPAYVMSVVVHEVFGHPEYGVYGTEYDLALYDKAQAKIPGYTKPAAGTKARTREIDAYAYQETEIYSLLRSFPYHTPIAAKDAKKGLVSIDPASTVQARLELMKNQWEPSLAHAIVRGLYKRLLADPRITGPAINAFRAGVKAVFPADEKAILK